MPQFDWHDDKARINIRKHRVSFEQARTIWQGPVCTEIDYDHSDHDIRYMTLGVVANSRKVLRVTHNEENDTIWIISARPASRREIEQY
jgi:uncharacterized DUF497 family protein